MAGCPPHEALAVIQQFLARSRQPAYVEAGEEPLPIRPDNHELRCDHGRLTLQVWNATLSVTRRVVQVEGAQAGRLTLHIERFAKRTGEATLLDLAKPRNRTTSRRTAQRAYVDVFRRALARQFPGWRVAEASSEPDLEHSLSPAYARAFLKRGNAGWAAIGVEPDAPHPHGILTFGLLWLDYLRRREQRTTIEGLALFLPRGQEAVTRQRLAWLDAAQVNTKLFVDGTDGEEQPVDTSDQGNLETELVDRRTGATPEGVDAWWASVTQVEGVEVAYGAGGGLCLRVQGLEFARWREGRLTFGLDEMHEASPAQVGEVVALARHLAARRHAGGDAGDPLWQRSPESWLEAAIERHLTIVDPALRPAPLYRHVLSQTGPSLGIPDLLGVGHDGQLAVVEVKATEDIHLPLQALDYWMRVRWHQERGEFATRGYFPGCELSGAPPRCVLVAPALQFHPSTETVLRFFSPAVPVERVGLSADWRQNVRVLFRVRGAQRPD